MIIRVLAIGDVCSDSGCEILLKKLPLIKRKEKIDMTIVNGENCSRSDDITPDGANAIFAAGADVITGGNHSLRRKEIFPLLQENPFLLRPHNLADCPGSGYCLLDKGPYRAAVINLAGLLFMNGINAQNPYTAAQELVNRARSDGACVIFVDFHAEATSEKRAMGFLLDGSVSAVFGTHTHVATADEQILPKGTGYITDLGMTGVSDSVLGVKKEIIIARLKDGDPARFEHARGKCEICGCIFEIDTKTGLCISVKRIKEKEF